MTLPGVAPVAPTSTTVNVANAGSGDADANCTGTAAAPTAPPDKVCIYVSSTNRVTLSTVSGLVAILTTRAFWLSFTPDTSVGCGDAIVYATWAYTAP